MERINEWINEANTDGRKCDPKKKYEIHHLVICFITICVRASVSSLQQNTCMLYDVQALFKPNVLNECRMGKETAGKMHCNPIQIKLICAYNVACARPYKHIAHIFHFFFFFIKTSFIFYYSPKSKYQLLFSI